MDKHTANSLIANTGLHFKTSQIEINPEEPLVLEGGKTLKYTFLESIDFLNDCRIRVDVCSQRDGSYVPTNYVKTNDLQELAPNGSIVLDECGVPKLSCRRPRADECQLVIFAPHQTGDRSTHRLRTAAR